MRRARLFGSHLTKGERRVYGAVGLFYAAAVLGMTWPVYGVFSRIRPLVLGMPFSLFYLSCWVVASFLVLLALFHWESGRGAHDEEPPGPGDRSNRGDGS